MAGIKLPYNGIRVVELDAHLISGNQIVTKYTFKVGTICLFPHNEEFQILFYKTRYHSKSRPVLFHYFSLGAVYKPRGQNFGQF